MENDKINLNEYLIKESEHVRKAYDERVSQTRTLRALFIISTGIIWAWSSTNSQIEAVQLLIWMPALITFLFGIGAWGNAKAMERTRDYLAKIEEYISLTEELGWGRHLKSNEEPILAMTAYIFWAVLQFFTIFIPIFINFA